MTDSTPGSDVPATPDPGVPSNAPEAASSLGSRASVTVDTHAAPADEAAAPAAPKKPAPRAKKTTPRATTGTSTGAKKRPATAKKAPAKKPAAKKPAATKKTSADEAPATDAPVTSGEATAGADTPVELALVIPPRPPLPARPPLPPLPPVPAVVAARTATAPEESTEPEPVPEADGEPVPEPEREPEIAFETEPAPEPEVVVEPEPVEPEPELVIEAETVLIVEQDETVLTVEPEETVLVAEPETDAAVEPGAEPATDPPPAVVGETVVEMDALPVDAEAEPALRVTGLRKAFGGAPAVDGIDLVVPAGSFYGLVGPNGAGKTTTLSMIAGLLRADAGEIRIAGVDARTKSREAKRLVGVLPDRLRTFDRLTGRQLLTYSGMLRGLSPATVDRRVTDLARAFDLTPALGRPVSDYSAGMTKKVMIAGALIHSPRLLVLDEPFEAVDPVSSGVILDILSTYVANGGTVLLSSHGMDLVERVCTRVAVMVSGQVLAEGTVLDVRGQQTLEERFLELIGGPNEVEGLEWLHTFSD